MENFHPEITDEKEKLRLLIDNCDERTEEFYVKHLTQAELDIKHEQLADTCIEQNRLEDELNEIKKSYKLKLDPLKSDMKGLLRQIGSRQEEIEGELYHFKDFDQGLLISYDSKGNFIKSRRLNPDEKQARLFIPAVNQ